MPFRSANKLLGALPANEYARLLPQLRTVHLSDNAPLLKCGDGRVYFPGTGVCSIGGQMEDGRTIEIAAVGNEGLVGLQSLCAAGLGYRQTFIQVSDGFAQFIPTLSFEREVRANVFLRDLVERYTRGFLESMLQAAACNRLHSLPERLCRWLLIMHDRVERYQFEVTRSFLAKALGAKPQELAIAIKTLESLHVVEFGPHSVTIFDRVSLERFACDCYAVMKSRYSPFPAEAAAEAETDAEPEPKPLAPVIRLRPLHLCARCGTSAATPHTDDRECIRAIDAELKALIHRAQRLNRQRVDLVRQRLINHRSFLQQSIKSS